MNPFLCDGPERVPSRWATPQEAGVEPTQESVIDFVNGVGEVSAETGQCVEIPRDFLPQFSLPKPRLSITISLTSHIVLDVRLRCCKKQE